MYQVEIVWNREFHFVPYGDPKETLEDARSFASKMKDLGDGASVKKAQVIDLETGEVKLKSYQI